MIPTEWHDLESNRLKKIKFVPNKYDLRGDVYIEFATGKVYKYKDVPSIHVEGVVHANHPGKVFYDKIAGGAYESERIES